MEKVMTHVREFGANRTTSSTAAGKVFVEDATLGVVADGSKGYLMAKYAGKNVWKGSTNSLREGALSGYMLLFGYGHAMWHMVGAFFEPGCPKRD